MVDITILKLLINYTTYNWGGNPLYEWAKHITVSVHDES